MDHILRTIKSIPFIRFKTFLALGGLEEETNINRRLRNFILTGESFPVELLKGLQETVKILYDMILEVTENPESTIKLKKYLNYKSLNQSIKENTLDFYLDSLDNLDKYIEEKIASFECGAKPANANNRVSIEEIRGDVISEENSEDLETFESLNISPPESLETSYEELSNFCSLPPRSLDLDKKIKPYRKLIQIENRINPKTYSQKISDFLNKKMP